MKNDNLERSNQSFWLQMLSEVGGLIRDLWHEDLEISYKSDGQPVTNIDLAVHEYFVQLFANYFPDDKVVSEESYPSSKSNDSDFVWLLDPIDGTRSMMKKKPEFTVSLALLNQGCLIMGMVYNPILDRVFWVTEHEPMFIQGVDFSAPARNKDTPLIFTSHRDYHQLSQQLSSFQCRPMGSIAQRMAMVAAGACDGAVGYVDMHEWDVAAGCLLAQRAGLVVSDLFGQPFAWNKPGLEVFGVLVAQRSIHSELLRMIGR